MRRLHRRLVRAYGPLARKPQLPIIDELILTVLSQHTSDANSGRAFQALKARFEAWDEVVAAPASAVADAIRSGGIAEIKARRIQAILREVLKREGSLDLSRLHTLEDEDVSHYLSSLPGVGPKTVACVLLFAMGRDVLPVDTHVHRVAVRLGLVPRSASAAAAQEALAQQVPAGIRYDLHLGLVAHGRKVCKARSPLCERCVLLDLCETGPRLLAMKGRVRAGEGNRTPVTSLGS